MIPNIQHIQGPNKDPRYIVIGSSNGEIFIDNSGNVLDRIFSTDIVHRKIYKFDVEEFKKRYGHLDPQIDILDIGYWTIVDGKDHFEPPVQEWRDEHRPIKPEDNE